MRRNREKRNEVKAWRGRTDQEADEEMNGEAKKAREFTKWNRENSQKKEQKQDEGEREWMPGGRQRRSRNEIGSIDKRTAEQITKYACMDKEQREDG